MNIAITLLRQTGSWKLDNSCNDFYIQCPLLRCAVVGKSIVVVETKYGLVVYPRATSRNIIAAKPNMAPIVE